jgi:uncharacterized protein YjbI with pentapeptide repeats
LYKHVGCQLKVTNLKDSNVPGTNMLGAVGYQLKGANLKASANLRSLNIPGTNMLSPN